MGQRKDCGIMKKIMPEHVGTTDSGLETEYEAGLFFV